MGYKAYELSNHLGNVLTTISDNYFAPQPSTGGVSARVLSSQDYFPFGMVMTERSFQENQEREYRFGFNTQEKDEDIDEGGSHYTAEFWEYDGRIGRRWNLDPKPNVSISSYAAFSLNPIMFSDVKGDTTRYYNNQTGELIEEIIDGKHLHSVQVNKKFYQESKAKITKTFKLSNLKDQKQARTFTKILGMVGNKTNENNKANGLSPVYELVGWWQPSSLVSNKSNFVGWHYNGYNYVETNEKGEKYRPNPKECYDLAQIQLSFAGVSSKGSNYAIQIFNENSGAIEANLSSGISLMLNTLATGKPILAGAHYKMEQGINDGTTDHFLAVVQVGNDVNGNYIKVFDNAHGGVNNGFYTMYFDQETKTLSAFAGHRDEINRPTSIIISQIRPNK